MPIKTMLIDADGVIQYAPQDWGKGFAKHVALDDCELEQQFTKEIFAAETSCLCRTGGFGQALDEVLMKWDRLQHRTAILTVMHDLRLFEEVVDTISKVRATGIRCYIASNQQSERARFMSDNFGFASLFDGELYSCNLGAAKPNTLFFDRALQAVGTTAESTLFIDDKPENVAGARRVGLNAFVYDGRSGAEALQSSLRKFGIAT